MRSIDIGHSGFELTKDVKKYVVKKLSKLDRLASKGSRQGMHAEVMLKEEKGKKKNKCTAEVILHLPHEQLKATESTVNIYAAIDIVEAKLYNQLRKYKEKHTDHSADRKGSFRRLRKLADKDYWGGQN